MVQFNDIWNNTILISNKNFCSSIQSIKPHNVLLYKHINKRPKTNCNCWESFSPFPKHSMTLKPRISKTKNIYILHWRTEPQSRNTLHPLVKFRDLKPIKNCHQQFCLWYLVNRIVRLKYNWLCWYLQPMISTYSTRVSK